MIAEKLEEIDEVQTVASNADFTDEMMEKIASQV